MKMKRNNIVKQKTMTGKPSVGSWNMIGHPFVTQILADAGFDWIVFDLEHGSFRFDQLASHCQLLEGKGIIPFCRLPGLQPEYFKWALDSGCQGVLVPLVRTKEDAEQSVRYSKYPPQGQRGIALTRVHGFGKTFDAYVDNANQETMVVLMIEHVEAVERIDEILGVPDVDAVFIGPYDLSGSMGLMGQLHHPKVEAACNRVKTAAIEKGIAAGLHIVEPLPGEVEQRIQEGYTLIAAGMDVTLLKSAVENLKNRKS